MQNVGQQYGQGGASSHPGAPYGHTDSSGGSTSGSITSSLRQFRKKDVEKQQINDPNTSVAESHVARVAPHNHYPPRSAECYRYPSQFQDYSLSSQVKYSEISDPQSLQEQLSPTVIQKTKGKEYMDMCNIQQNHMKQPYPDHINGQQSYPPDSNLHPHAQYLQKDPQVHPSYKPESQYFPKEPQYQHLPHQIQKYNMPTQIRKYPTESDFLSKLRRIHPTMARSIMSDHHLQESQPSYQSMDQNRMYPHQNQRYMNYSSPMQGNPYPPSYMPPQHYTNYPASCSYTRPPQLGPRFPSINHEDNVSPRRNYTDNLPIPPINYTALPQKISPNYSQYNTPEYAQHYQHRRPTLAPQEYYQQHCRPTQYLPHQMPSQEENRVTVSDSIKQYIENWADEETASEMNQIETNRLCKENLRVREDQSTETVYMINASELQYLENGLPLVTSENGIPLVAENGQYILKSGVAIDNSTGMVRIVEKSNHLEPSDSNVDRVVNLHIVDPLKPDCMLASKPNELNLKPNNLYNTDEKPRVVIHQNTVIQPGQQSIPKETENIEAGVSQNHNQIVNSLPLISDGTSLLEKLDESIFKECKKETVDKNCSPINVEQMETLDEFEKEASHTSVICPTRLLEDIEDINEDEEISSESTNDLKLKNMPIIDLLAEEIHNTPEEDKSQAEKPTTKDEIECRKTEHCNLENVNKRVINEEKNTSDAEHIIDEGIKNIITTTNEEKIRQSLDQIEDKTDGNIKNENGEMGMDVEDEIKKDIEANSKVLDEVTAKATEVCTKEETIKKEESLEDVAQKPETVNTENLVTSNITEDKIVKNEESMVVKQTNVNIKRENETTGIAQEETGDKKINDGINCSENKNLDEKIDNSTLDKVSSANENINRPSVKRSRRIFSVDDIINNIGNNMNKSNVEKERVERRRSLQLTREFLEKEIDHSYSFFQKLAELKGTKIEACKTVSEDKEETRNVTKELEKKDHQIIEPIKEEKDKNGSEEACDKQSVKGEESGVQEHKPTDNSECTLNCNVKFDTAEDRDELPVESTSEKSVSNQNSSEITTEVSSNINEESTPDDPEVEEGRLSLKETEFEAQNEIHYRNAIRIEESCVLLQIAGELVEINVSSVNGKKVITVVPMSDSTIVDFNDNYETSEHSNIIDETKIDMIETEHSEMMPEEVIPQPDIIETTSEIIIGMDISLEEEIQLDLERPQVLCTKAAKKAYENDLQIPSITTSEDINDNNKTDSYSGNDKVSSSKEQHQPKDKEEKKKDVEIEASKNKVDDIVKSSKCHSPDPDKKVLRELLKVRKIKKEKIPAQNIEEQEEFVPFKDLVKARKLKKLKLQQLKSNEDVSADSTNKIDQEENKEVVDDSKPKKTDTKEKEDEETNKVKSVESKDVSLKNKEHKAKISKKLSTTETAKEDTTEKYKNDKGAVKVENKKRPIVVKEENNKTNTSTMEKKEIIDKVTKKVTFGPVNYCLQQKPAAPSTEIRTIRLQDPRIRSKTNKDVMVPSISEILKENDRLDNHKKRLSLEEYNNRKRKLSINSDGGDKEAKFKKTTIESEVHNEIISPVPPEKTITAITGFNKQESADQLKMPRPKSLDDLKIPNKPRDNVLTKRKLSLEVTTYKPNDFDWEETQSPKTNLTFLENNNRCLSEFSGLISNNKSKIVIDINDLNVKRMPSESSEDEILQNYKEQVDSKLSSLNIQIPRVAKLPNNVFNPFSKPETNNLMQRFLKNEKITYEEMEKIKKIISYKRLVQQLKKIKSPDLTSQPLNPSYEIRKNCPEKDMKLHLKKVPGKKSKQRFRNLYSESINEPESDCGDIKKNDGDYSVVQANCFAAGVPKLIIKRKTEMPVPVVRLERLDLGLLVKKKRKLY